MPSFEARPLRPSRLQIQVANELRKGRVLTVVDIQSIAVGIGYSRSTGRSIPGTIVGGHFFKTTGLKVEVPYPGIYVAEELDPTIKGQKVREVRRKQFEEREKVNAEKRRSRGQ